MSSPVLAALLVASTAATAYSAYSSQEAANKAAEANAKNLEQQAVDTIQAGEDEASQYKAKVRQMIGTQEATYGASNIDISSGSAKQITTETQEIGESDAETIIENAKKKASYLRGEASAYQAGEVSSLLAGGSSLLQSSASNYGSYLKAT